MTGLEQRQWGPRRLEPEQKAETFTTDKPESAQAWTNHKDGEVVKKDTGNEMDETGAHYRVK